MLRTQLSESLKEAMKSKDRRATATLRLILAALKDRDIAARTKGEGDGVGDQEILELLQRMVRQGHEAIDMYTQGERPDLVEKESEEIAIIERFLPQPLAAEAQVEAIDEVIEELQAGHMKDMGRVMAMLKSRYAGRMDFAKAGALVKQRLSTA